MYGASGVLNWNTYERLARAVTLRSPPPRGSLPDSGQRQWLPQSPVSHWTPETQIRRGRLRLPELVVQKGVSCTERRAPQVPRAGALAYLVECWDCYERGKTPEPLQSEANPKDLRVQGRAIAAGEKGGKRGHGGRESKKSPDSYRSPAAGRQAGTWLTCSSKGSVAMGGITERASGLPECEAEWGGRAERTAQLQPPGHPALDQRQLPTTTAGRECTDPGLRVRLRGKALRQPVATLSPRKH